MTAKEVITQIKQKKSLYEHYIKQQVDFEKEQNKYKDDITVFQSKQATYENILAACKLILEKITYNSKIKLEQFLTYSLQQIFIDKHYEIIFSVKEDSKRPGLEIILKDNGVEQEITDAIGGGILSTLGLLLLIYYIEVYELNRILFIDEGLKEISTGLTTSEHSVNYLMNVLNFLKYLSKEKQYKFVIITHDNNVRKVADRIYEVSDGEVILAK